MYPPSTKLLPLAFDLFRPRVFGGDRELEVRGGVDGAPKVGAMKRSTSLFQTVSVHLDLDTKFLSRNS